MCIVIAATHRDGTSVLATDCGAYARQDERILPDPSSGAWRTTSARWLAFSEPRRTRCRRLRGGWVAALGDLMYATLALAALESYDVDLDDEPQVRAVLAGVADALPSIARRHFPGWSYDPRTGHVFTMTASGIASYRRDGSAEAAQIESAGAVHAWAGMVPGGLGASGGSDYEPHGFRAAVRAGGSVFDVVRAIADECGRIADRTMCVTDELHVAIGLDRYLEGRAHELALATDDGLAARIGAPGPNAPIGGSIGAIRRAMATPGAVREIPPDDPVVRFLERDRRSWLAGDLIADGCQVRAQADA